MSDPCPHGAESVVPLAALLEFIEEAEHYCPTCPEELQDTYVDAHGLRLFLQQFDGASDADSAESVPFREACRIVLQNGYTPVNTQQYQRLRAWLNLTNGYPPKDWDPELLALNDADCHINQAGDTYDVICSCGWKALDCDDLESAGELRRLHLGDDHDE